MRAILVADGRDPEEIRRLLGEAIAGIASGDVLAGITDPATGAGVRCSLERGDLIPPDRSSAAPSERKFYRHTFIVEVISPTDISAVPWPGLAELQSMAEEGEARVNRTLATTEKLDGPAAAAALEAMDTDPGFFDLTPDGRDQPQG